MLTILPTNTANNNIDDSKCIFRDELKAPKGSTLWGLPLKGATACTNYYLTIYVYSTEVDLSFYNNMNENFESLKA